MTLKTDIKAWDGKSAIVMGRVYDRHVERPSFLAEVVSVISDESLQDGATWLLKHHLERESPLDAAQAKEVFQTLPKISNWGAKLHILQSLRWMPIPTRYKKKLEAFLRACLQAENKFVRAWAYSGFYELAKQHPEYRLEAQRLCEQAVNSEAASVKARIRNILAKGF